MQRGKRVAAPTGPTRRSAGRRRAAVPDRRTARSGPASTVTPLTRTEVWSATLADARRRGVAAPGNGLRVALGLGALVVGGTLAWGVDRVVVDGERGAGDRQASANRTHAAGSTPVPSPSGQPAGLEGSPPPRAKDPLRSRDAGREDRVVLRGQGTFAVVPLISELAPDPEAETYTVEVERGIRVDPEVVTATVDAVLADARGWRSKGHTLARTDRDPDFRILVASPKTTDNLCAPLETEGRVSCHNQDGNVVLNSRRWVDGIPDYGNDLVLYRTYLINHEVGHHLGYQHETCAGSGRPAPVMMQQTYGLKGCARNVWPP